MFLKLVKQRLRVKLTTVNHFLQLMRRIESFNWFKMIITPCNNITNHTGIMRRIYYPIYLHVIKQWVTKNLFIIAMQTHRREQPTTKRMLWTTSETFYEGDDYLFITMTKDESLVQLKRKKAKHRIPTLWITTTKEIKKKTLFIVL